LNPIGLDIDLIENGDEIGCSFACPIFSSGDDRFALDDEWD
jgi:hypothetical protein